MTAASPVASMEFDSDGAIVLSGDSCRDAILTFDLTSSNVRDDGKDCLAATCPSLVANALPSESHHDILCSTGDARDHVFEQTLVDDGESNGVGANFDQIGGVGAGERAHGATQRDFESGADSPDRDDGVVEATDDLELERLNVQATLEYPYSQNSHDDMDFPCVPVPSPPPLSESSSPNPPSPGELALSSPRTTRLVNGVAGSESAGENVVGGNDSDVSCSFEILEGRSRSRHSISAPMLPLSPYRPLPPSGSSLNPLVPESNANGKSNSNSHPPDAAHETDIRHESERGLVDQRTTIRHPRCDNATASSGAIPSASQQFGPRPADPASETMHSLDSTNQVTAAAQQVGPTHARHGGSTRYDARGESAGGGVAERMPEYNSMTLQELGGMMSVYGLKRKPKRCVSVLDYKKHKCLLLERRTIRKL